MLISVKYSMLDKVGQQNGHPQQTNKIDSLHTGHFNTESNMAKWH